MNRVKSLLLITGVTGTVAVGFFGPSNVDPANKFSWGENIGWMNWRDANSGSDGVVVNSDHLEGYVWCENVGWINVGNGGGPYVNTDGSDFGVNILGSGNLEGYAWGENIGWINFDTSTTSDPARYDDGANRFRGYAWGENVGWVNLDDDTHYVGAVVETPIDPLLPAPSPDDFRRNRYIAFGSNNADPIVIQVQVAELVCDNSGDACSYDRDCPDFDSGETCLTSGGFDPVSSGADPEWEVIGWLGEPCSITPGTQVPADTWHAMVVSDTPTLPGFEYTDPDIGDPLPTVFVADCEIMPRFSYGLRASVDGNTFTERLLIGTILEPVKNAKKWADVVGQRDAGTGEYTEPNRRINVDDVQVMIVFLNSKPYRPHLTVLDLSHEVPGYKINADDLQMVMRAFGITEDYPPLKFQVEASGAVHPRDCPFDSAATVHEKCQ